MNCANHPDLERAAFCQNCGKPLCTECVRNVGPSVFCEPCLTARVAGPPHPFAGPQAGPAGYPPPGPPAASGEPNPGLAALLGFIPGVGAMYNEQYAKGIVHLMVFAVLVSLASDANGIFTLFVFGWIFYMVIEAHHTARARRDGTPLPNPFGLNDLSERLGFGKAWPGNVPPSAAPGSVPTPPTAGFAAGNPAAGPAAPPVNPNVPPANPYMPPYSSPYTPPAAHWAVPPDAAVYGMPPVPPVPPVPPTPPYPDPAQPYHRGVPTAAIWLIVLGAIFLLGNIPFLHVIRGRLLAPIVVIGLGIWLFVRRMTTTGEGFENDGTAYYHWRLRHALSGSFWLVFLGFLWLLDALRVLSFGHSWPLLLIAIGVMMFLGRSVYPGYGYVPPPGTTPPPATTTALAPIDQQTQTGDSDQGGR